MKNYKALLLNNLYDDERVFLSTTKDLLIQSLLMAVTYIIVFQEFVYVQLDARLSIVINKEHNIIY